MITPRDRTPCYDLYRRALRSGVLVRPEVCGECGQVCKPDGHHADYAKPTEVRWLCKPCHIQAHKVLRKDADLLRVPDMVLDLHNLGWRLADIGRAFDISPQRVHQILKRLKQ